MTSVDAPGNDSFYFELPAGLIAQDPLEARADSRLLLVETGSGVGGEAVFRDLPKLLRAGDLLVLNDSRVLPARLNLRRADSGGRVEVLLVRPVAAGGWLAMARPVKRLRPGQRLVFCSPRGDECEGPQLEILEIRGDGFIVVTCGEMEMLQVAEDFGEVPLPPYIGRDAEAPDHDERSRRDRRRYQTVYAAGRPGSVAAPTAGLHFDAEVLAELAAAGIATTRVTLHVGPGTFRPPTEEQIAARRLHGEVFHFSARTAAAVHRCRAAGGRIIAVGTTSLRVLETVARLQLNEAVSDAVKLPVDGDDDAVFTGTCRRAGSHWSVEGTTRLFIRPPDRVSAADGLLTNFHLPGSSLLMLVASLIGEIAWRPVYEHAVAGDFRFYSYGDAMLILPGEAGGER